MSLYIKKQDTQVKSWDSNNLFYVRSRPVVGAREAVSKDEILFDLVLREALQFVRYDLASDEQTPEYLDAAI